VRSATARSRRLIRSGWTGAHAAVAGVPRWARIAAYAIPLTVLPSSVWRIAAYTFHPPIADGATHAPSGLPGVSLELYVCLLSVVSELAAFAGVGLVAGWGEIVPRWIPALGGHHVPKRAAVLAGALGAAFLTLLWTLVAVRLALGQRIDGSPRSALAPLNFHDWRGAFAVIAYAPLVLWGLLLAAVTVAYHKRRRASSAVKAETRRMPGARVARARGSGPPSGRRGDILLMAYTVVDVPFAEIDQVFLHPTGLRLWDESVARVELLSAGEFKPGFRFDTIGPRRETRSSYVVTAVSPMMWRTRRLNSRVLARAAWTMCFEPLGARTRVTCAVEMTLRRGCKWLGPLLRRLTPRMKHNMRLLKAAIEQRHAHMWPAGARTSA
jgi:hypothetical protein